MWCLCSIRSRPRSLERATRGSREGNAWQSGGTTVPQARQPPSRGAAAGRVGDRAYMPALGAGPQERPNAHHPGLAAHRGRPTLYSRRLRGSTLGRERRGAGWGVISRGRKRERVDLVELPPEERVLVLREVPREVPRAAWFLRQRYGISDDPDAFAALAYRCSVFRTSSTTPRSSERWPA